MSDGADTVRCPCCGFDTRVPKHIAGTRWLPGQVRVVARWVAAGIPHKTIARAFGSARVDLRNMLDRNQAEVSASWGDVDWHEPPSVYFAKRNQ